MVGGVVELVDVLDEEHVEVGHLSLADGVVIRQVATLAWTAALGRLVVSHVVGQSRVKTFVEHPRIADRRVSCNTHIAAAFILLNTLNSTQLYYNICAARKLNCKIQKQYIKVKMQLNRKQSINHCATYDQHAGEGKKATVCV